MATRADLIRRILLYCFTGRVIILLRCLRRCCLIAAPLFVGVVQVLQVTMAFICPARSVMGESALRAGDNVVGFGKCLLTYRAGISFIKVQ